MRRVCGAFGGARERVQSSLAQKGASWLCFTLCPEQLAASQLSASPSNPNPNPNNPEHLRVVSARLEPALLQHRGLDQIRRHHGGEAPGGGLGACGWGVGVEWGR